MRIAVTGASGFMGGTLAICLARQGHTVFAFGRRRADELRRALPNYLQWDFLSGCPQLPDVDAVVHCAALVNDWGSDAEYRSVNVDGTKKVLEAFDSAEIFVHVSSASVYSTDQHDQLLTEDASVGVGLHNAYARSKAEAEQVVLSSRRDAVILRPHIVYGPGDTTLMPRILAARRFGWLAVPGNGKNRISVTHIGNFVYAVERILETSVMQGIFNVADIEPVPVDELLRTLLPLNGAATRLLYVPRHLAWAAASASEGISRITGRRRAPTLTRYLVTQIADGHRLDLSRVQQHLAYAPRYSFRDNAGPELLP